MGRMLQDCKHLSLQLGSVATNATATANIDTRGWKYLTVTVSCDTAASTTSNPATLKLQEADDTNATSFTDITGFVGDTGFTIPNAETTKTTSQFAVLNLNLMGRKRYIRTSLTSAGAAQICAVNAILSNANEAPDSTSERGALVSVVG